MQIIVTGLCLDRNNQKCEYDTMIKNILKKFKVYVTQKITMLEWILLCVVIITIIAKFSSQSKNPSTYLHEPGGSDLFGSPNDKHFKPFDQ